MTATGTYVGRVPREAASLAGVAWAYLALRSTGTPAAATAALATFRELYGEVRPGLVEALASLRLVTREQAEATLPRVLTPAPTVRREDITALAISIYPICELSRLNAASLLPRNQQGEVLADTDAPNWGTAEDLRGIFSAAPATEAGLNAWFARLTAVWPDDSRDPYARQLWWFANLAHDEAPTAVGGTLERAFLNYSFASGSASYVRPDTSVQEAAAARVPPEALSPPVTAAEMAAPEPPPIELDPTVITARAAGRGLWQWFMLAAVILGVGGLSWYLWSYRRAKPWRSR